MIISSLNTLGLKLYERKRIFEEVIDFNPEEIPCDDIGIYIIGEYPRLKYNHVSIYNKHEWGTLVFETFSLAFLNLMNKDLVEIICFKDKKTYLFNAFTLNTTGYYFKTVKSSNGKTISYLKKENAGNSSLNTTVDFLLSSPSVTVSSQLDQDTLLSGLL